MQPSELIVRVVDRGMLRHLFLSESAAKNLECRHFRWLSAWLVQPCRRHSSSNQTYYFVTPPPSPPTCSEN
ncbi:hypothetical protein V9T40_000903 [Parthenolecanium corni]|uniref:Uncharacterized protein n=1 Tax=Parthenolecanium corni TaxID=536013 RepID=A0AAN9Y0V7_9HEMI